MEFKDKLKQLRNEKNITQETLANEIHVSRSTIAKWEAGLGLPQNDSLNELCLFFNVSKDELISTNYKEEALINKNLKIHSLNKKVLTLSILIGIILMISIMILLITFNNVKVYYSEDDYYTSIQLRNYSDVNSKLTSYAGRIERPKILLNYEHGYSYQIVEFEKIKFTNASSLILIKITDELTPGSVASFNNDSYNNNKYNKHSKLDKVSIEISLPPEVNPIYSFPNLEPGWTKLNSKYSENIEFNNDMNFSYITIQNIQNSLQFYYNGRFDEIILSNDKKEIIRGFDYNKTNNSTIWTYEMYNQGKDLTLRAYSFYLIEVNDIDNDSFDFNITTSMTNGKHIISRKQFITCFI